MPTEGGSLTIDRGTRAIMPPAYASATVDFDYTIRRSDRARRVRVTVDVTTASRSSCRAAPASARRRPRSRSCGRGSSGGWPSRQRLRARIAARGATVPYLGQALALAPQAGARARAPRAATQLLVPAGDPRPALERWYRRTARDEIEPRVARGDRACWHVDTGAISIRGQRTRWGSCSASGALSFNWRLLLAPEEVLDYVVWHEACHLRGDGPLAALLGLVERHVPDYRVPRRWLADNGATLVL